MDRLGHDRRDGFQLLEMYRQKVSAKKTEQREEWDELEKSIIAKLADEVRVWLKPDATEIVAEKVMRL